MATEKVRRSVLPLYGIFAFVLATILGTSVVTSSVPSQVYLYSAAHSDDAKFYIYSQVNEPDVRSHKNLNMTGGFHYICVVGVWIGYSQQNYGSRIAEYGNYDGTSELKCYQGYAFRSLRHAGVEEDVSIPSLNLYQNSSFEGYEKLVAEDTPTLDGISYKSIIRMVNESWTLYTNENYSGASFCVDANYYHSIPFPVASIKKGC